MLYHLVGRARGAAKNPTMHRSVPITKCHLVKNIDGVNLRNSGVHNTVFIVTGNTKVIPWVRTKWVAKVYTVVDMFGNNSGRGTKKVVHNQGHREQWEIIFLCQGCHVWWTEKSSKGSELDVLSTYYSFF